MAVNPEQATQQLLAFVRGLTFRQQITLIVGAAVVAGTIWGFVTLFDKANYKALYSGLSTSDAQSISQQLSAKNIPFQLSSDGTSIMVPADQLDKARLELAAAGLPQSGRMGFELFDKPNWTGSDFAEKVNYQRALEGELERTIETLGEVDAVRVHLVMPQESLFTDQERDAKASVVIKLKGGRLSDESQEAITHLVASAVDNLKPENVTLINAEGGMPFLAHTGGTQSRPRFWSDYETALARKVIATLEPVVGVGKVRANVTAEYDLAASESTQEIYDPNGAVVLTSQISEERVGEIGAQGNPGTPSNVPGKQPTPPPKAIPAPLDETQGLHTESKTFAVSKTVRHSIEPAGALKHIDAAVLVDDATETTEKNGRKVENRRKRTPEEMKQIEDLVVAAIGIDTTRGDKAAVENLSFNSLPIETPPTPNLVQRVLPMVEKWINVIRYGVLILLFLLVYLLVLRPIKDQIVVTFQELPQQIARSKAEREALPGAGGAGTLKSEDRGGVEASLSHLGDTPLETKQAVMLKKNLLEKVKKEPAGASRVIQNWMRQQEDKR